MIYQEALDSIVSREEARREILRHGSSFDEFLQDCGNHQQYEGAEVLAWLGY